VSPLESLRHTGSLVHLLRPTPEPLECLPMVQLSRQQRLRQLEDKNQNIRWGLRWHLKLWVRLVGKLSSVHGKALVCLTDSGGIYSRHPFVLPGLQLARRQLLEFCSRASLACLPLCFSSFSWNFLRVNIKVQALCS